jgi:DNA-binding transcriptional LysR family regulator
MELTQLQTFVVVAEEKNLTRAAKRLFTTASSLSVQIKLLEDELGVVLFVRTARGMQITEKGEALLLKARHALESVHDLVNHATQIRADLIGKVTIGLNASMGFLRIAPLIQQLYEEASGIQLHFQHLASGQILEALTQETLDVGFVFDKVNDNRLSVQKLQTTQLVMVAPKAWQLAQADWQTLSQQVWVCSDGYCPFQNIIAQAFAARSLPYKTIVKTNDDLSKADLVMAGVGLSLLEISEAQALERTHKVEIVQDVSFPCDLSIVSMHYRQHDPLVQTVLATVQEQWRL